MLLVLAGVPVVAQQQEAALTRLPASSSHPDMAHGAAHVSAGWQGARIIAAAPKTSARTLRYLNIVGERYTRIPDPSNEALLPVGFPVLRRVRKV